MKLLLAPLLFFFVLIVHAQDAVETRKAFSYDLFQTDQDIAIDGNEDDNGWAQARTIQKLQNHWPIDTGNAEAVTEVKMTYDSEFIYVLATCYDKGERIIQSLKRDDEDAHWGSDNFTIVIDPMNNKQNGFMFGVNAGGSQIEAQLNMDGARTQYDENWDNKWFSSVVRYEDKWVVEMAIPFKTLRYSTNGSEWGVNFIRGDMERNVYSTWTQFPLNYSGIDLNFMGTLDWDQNPAKASGKVVLVPYIAGGTKRDFEDAEQRTYQREVDTGLDAKISITGSLSLDLTLNPDFSNVDVDQQVTNLSRFSISLPERRNFFLENGDIFSNFGGWEINPFFSRRIGLIDGEQVPITYGARLTGNVGNSTRVGLMNVQTQEFGEVNAQNYSVMAVHQQVLDRSIIKGIFINRETDANVNLGKYARNGGLEFAFISKDAKINNTVRFHGATTDEHLGNNSHYGFGGNYNGRSLRMGWDFDVVGENYITDLGFNPRLENYNAETEEVLRQGYTRINPWAVYRFYPEGSSLNSHGPRSWHMVWLNQDGSGLNERAHGYAYDFQFKNTSNFRLQAQQREVNLPVPTSLIGADVPLPEGNYQFTQYWVNYNTDLRKIISAEFRVQYGDFFSGDRFNTSTSLNFRAQPWGTFGISHDFNQVDLKENFGQATLHFLLANAQISFSNSMFWTTAVQFNSQAENYNIFSRFQWRYRPMSDFFLVYTDNYTTDGLQVKNRQLVFKLTYWLNM
ncbi:MAG: carbohydrate binding family 9 domain-containing protein [Cytophagales bacterium]|nr:carbohydrate binding family 9 domain-containing protein [Cytophagales bacterium]